MENKQHYSKVLLYHFPMNGKTLFIESKGVKKLKVLLRGVIVFHIGFIYYFNNNVRNLFIITHE